MRWTWALAGIFLVAVGAVLMAPAFGTSTITDTRATADFGFPLTWVEQDMSELEPPGPMETGPRSPWEYPTDVDYAALGLNVLIAAAVGGVLTGSFVVWNRRRSPTRDWPQD
ncbi:ABC-type transport system involved in cytochrome c biogenesis permease subunit [Marmoricola sp. OAE513]|uniref:hypothetical protein n=1 Tax=Marmoricola sp. OAE513 TaxID=2817894 RepID=UPI001AEB5BE2